MQRHTNPGQQQRAERAGTVVLALATTSLLLCGCATGTPSASASTSDSARTASARPAPGRATPTATATAGRKYTSYQALGAFGTFAKLLDVENGLKPDFDDWADVAETNCQILGSALQGQPGAEAIPNTMNVLKGGSRVTEAGRSWAAAVTTRCLKAVRRLPKSKMLPEETAGLAWVVKQGGPKV